MRAVVGPKGLAIRPVTVINRRPRGFQNPGHTFPHRCVKAPESPVSTRVGHWSQSKTRPGPHYIMRWTGEAGQGASRSGPTY